MYVTKQYKLKHPPKELLAMARAVNFVWNYCNEWSYKSIVNNSKFLSAYDFHKLTAGCSSELGIHSQTIQAICEEYTTRRKQFKKNKLSWRSKKSLGWIPFKSCSYLGEGLIKHNGIVFKFWESREVGEIRSGSFCQDSKGDWYVNLVTKVEDIHFLKSGNDIGVDLGLKTTATYSDGDSFEGEKPTRKFANKLAIAQRARKKRQVTAIQRKIKNIRKDSLHKETTRLVKKYDLIVVGDVSSMKLVKTKMAKSTLDVSWGAYKSLLAYKTIRFGKELKVVKESWTSKTCHACGSVADFGGLSGLSVREWTCRSCGETHDRDVNAAKNILRIGHDTPLRESHCLQA